MNDPAILVNHIFKELDRARRMHPDFPTMMHGYAVLQEEVEELWEEVKRDRPMLARDEAIQVAAMAIRFILDLGLAPYDDRPAGSGTPHPG